MLGYMGRRGYWIWVPESKKIEESHDVTFEEGRSHCRHSTQGMEDASNEGIQSEPIGTTTPESGKPDDTITTNTTSNHHQTWGTHGAIKTLDPIQEPPPNQMETPKLQIAPNPPLATHHSS